MKPELDASLRKMADGTVLIMQVGYENTNRVYSYAMLKAGGYWYVTGSGKAPQAAGWGAVRRWLGQDGRVVKRIERMTGTEVVWSKPEPEKAPEPE